jgi:hypothetical protein
MSNATYQPKVYREQGGNKLVVAQGGTLEIAGTVTGLSAGTDFYVSSVTGSSANDGLSFSAPLATLAQAIALCTANKGDRIFLMPGHAETIGASGPTR